MQRLTVNTILSKNLSRGNVMGSKSDNHSCDVKKTITMQDVAKAAGVSISTVSRVLDERLPTSRSEAANKVRQVAKSLGYHRDYVASSLRRGDSGTIGILVPRLTDTVTAMLYEEISRAAARRGYFTIVATCGDEQENEASAVESLLARRVDGLIMSTCRLGDVLPQQLRSRNIPHVLALRTDGISQSSVGDDEQGAYFATRHLIDLGHRDIGIIAGPDFASNAVNRREGFKRAMAEAGLNINNNWYRCSDFNIQSGEYEGNEILKLSQKPSAIFAVNDDLAIGVMSAAHRLGIIIGDDLSLVGYNDIPLVSRLPIPLTSVKTPFDQIASYAVDTLLSADGKTIQHHIMPSLIPRGSTKPFLR